MNVSLLKIKIQIKYLIFYLLNRFWILFMDYSKNIWHYYVVNITLKKKIEEKSYYLRRKPKVF